MVIKALIDMQIARASLMCSDLQGAQADGLSLCHCSKWRNLPKEELLVNDADCGLDRASALLPDLRGAME
jgi:hypothetical protein